jgi:hypothetical protein
MQAGLPLYLVRVTFFMENKIKAYCQHCNKEFTPKRTLIYCSNACRLSIKRKPIEKIFDLENEIWKPVFEYENLYEVSNFGRVKRKEKKVYSEERNCYFIKKERICNQFVDRYKYVNLVVYGVKTKRVTLHRIIANAFIPNPQNKPCVNHKDGNKLNNSIENLEWVTRSENTRHAYKNNLIPNGENHPKSKLTNSQVIDIYKRVYSGETCIKLSKEFNVHPETITNIKFKRMWKNVLNKTALNNE